MSKADRNRATNARSRIAEQQAAARRAERQRRLLTVIGAVVLVVIIVVAFIVIKGLQKPAKQSGGTAGGLPTQVVSNVTGVPASTLAKVGTGALPGLSGLPLK